MISIFNSNTGHAGSMSGCHYPSDSDIATDAQNLENDMKFRVCTEFVSYMEYGYCYLLKN